MSHVFLKGWRLGLVELIYERFMMRYILRKVCKDFPSILLPSFGRDRRAPSTDRPVPVSPGLSHVTK